MIDRFIDTQVFIYLHIISQIKLPVVRQHIFLKAAQIRIKQTIMAKKGGTCFEFQVSLIDHKMIYWFIDTRVFGVLQLQLGGGGRQKFWLSDKEGFFYSSLFLQILSKLPL